MCCAQNAVITFFNMEVSQILYWSLVPEVHFDFFASSRGEKECNGAKIPDFIPKKMPQ